jgi:hypothetical protein
VCRSDGALAEEGDAVFFITADVTPQPSLGVVVGAMCTFRFVLPADADVAGAVTPREDADAVQCSPESILSIVESGVDAAAALRDARAAAAAVMAARAAPE